MNSQIYKMVHKMQYNLLCVSLSNQFPNCMFSYLFLFLVAKSCLTLLRPPWTAAHQVSLPFTISRSLLKFMSIQKMMLSNHLILCHTLLLLPSVFPSIRVFSSELALYIRWPKYWSFSFSISPSNKHLGWFPLGLTDLILLCKGLSGVFSTTTIW